MAFDLNFASKGEGLPFVFQHGLGSNLEQPQNLLAGLKGVQLTSMDCRGHGRSPLSASALPSFNNYTDDVVRLMDRLNIEKAILGGISMGSGISLNLALRYPNRVMGLVLVRPAWLDRPTPANLAILLEVAKYVDRAEGIRQFKAWKNYRDMEAALPNAAASVLGQFNRAYGEHTAGILRCMVGDVPVVRLEELSRVNIPCLILANEDDPLHPYAFGAALHKALPQASLEKVISRYVDNDRHTEEVRKHTSNFIDRYFR